jgi:hypothetical protein
VSYRWTPPSGATSFSFNPPPEPGGPPYIWLDRAPTDEIYISYDQPSLPPGESTMLATDTALAEWEGQSSATSYTVLITNEPPGLTNSPPQAATGHNSPAATVELWEIEQWADPRGITLTTELCQDWFDLFQSDEAFLALRAPVSATTTVTEGYQLPIVFGGPYSNTFQLFSYDAFAPVITVPVELRPARHTFLENELPSAPGEHWLALGLGDETVTCPASDLAADRWGFLTQGYLDLTHQANNCERCVLPFYYCYDGQDAPLLAAAYAFSALDGREATSYQGWGLTCVGPYAATLVHDSAWSLGGASSVSITPTQSISLGHYIHLNLFSEPMTFTLDYTSDLGIAWQAYGGDWTGPDLDDPITGPVPVAPGLYQRFWLISDPTPAGTAAGPYTLLVTATSVLSPTDSFWASDAIWVGGWVAPPPPVGQSYWTYLPVVLRSH